MTDRSIRRKKRHWDFKTFLCTGREWQRGSMVFTKRMADVTCNTCHGAIEASRETEMSDAISSKNDLTLESQGGRKVVFELDEDGELVIGIDVGDNYDDVLLSVEGVQRLREWLRLPFETTAPLPDLLRDLDAATRHCAVHGDTGANAALLSKARDAVLDYDWCMRVAAREQSTETDRMRAALLEILEHDQNPQAKHVARRGLGSSEKSGADSK